MNKNLKIVVAVLVAVNVIYFAVMKSGMFDAAQVLPAQRALHAEKITLLAASQPVTELAQSAVAPAASLQLAGSTGESCYEWGNFSGAELERAKKALGKLQLGDALTQREIEQVIGFWVYMAPLKDKAAVNQKIAQLKTRGVTEYFVVQEAGEWQNAISLGIFKTREAAQAFLDGLNAKDVRTAQVGERSSKTKTTLFAIKGLDAEKSGKLTNLQKDYQGTELKSVSCH